MIKGFLKKLFCQHGNVWNIKNISFDGVTIVECKKCGKIKKIPLGK